MNKKNVWWGAGAFAVICAITAGVANRNSVEEEVFEDTVASPGKFRLIPPLKSDIRNVQARSQPMDSSQGNAFRSPASKGAPVSENKAALYQAYRNTLLKLGKDKPEEQKLIREILDFVQYAKPDELPVTQVVASNSGVSLAAPIEEAKIHDPELRAKWRKLMNITAATAQK